MSNVPLATLLPELGEITQATAQGWVDAALAHATALREYDSLLYPRDPGRQTKAASLHHAWRLWLDDAEAVLKQADSVAAQGGEISHLDALRDSIGRAGAMLQLSPALMAKRRDQVERGEVFTLEEVRRELRGTGGR